MPTRAESAHPLRLPAPKDRRFWRLRSQNEIDQLRQVLHGAESELSPEWAADALSKSPHGIKVLRAALASGVPAATRRAAVYGFVWVKRPRPEDLNRLLRIYQDPTETPDIRGQAAEALATRFDFRPKAGRVRRRDAFGRDALLRGLDAAEAEVRFWSIYALANPENEWVLPKLESMTSDPALVPGTHTVGQEAQWAIRWIRRQEDMDPDEL